MNKPKYQRNQRFLWYIQVDRHQKSVKETCATFGISRKCYYHWYRKDHGLGDNRYRNMKNQPNTKLTQEIREYIEEKKIRTNYGPLKMKILLEKELGLIVSTTVIYRYYKKKMLIRKPQKRLPWYEPMKHCLTIEKMGQGVQFDIKYVYPRGKRLYQFSAFDPYTKKYYFLVFKTKESKNAIKVFKQAEKYFGFKIISVQTDNGSEFRGVFHEWLTKKHIPHYFIPKRSPWWNSNVERAHRTIDEEYYHNSERVWKDACQWLTYYNFERIHLSLGGLTPHEKYLQSVTLDC